MANLKGSTFVKQSRDALIRLDKRGEAKHKQKSAHYTHSNAIYKQREAILRDFSNFLTEKGLEGKLNTHITDTNIVNFLAKRTKDLSQTATKTYARAFSGLLQGLQSANITIKTDYISHISDFLARPNPNHYPTQKNGRYIPQNDFYGKIKTINQNYQAIAKVQYEYGFRSAEAIKIAKDPDKYIKNGKIIGVKGKGGRVYKPKPIAKELETALKGLKTVPALSTYQKEIKSVLGHRSHDLRLSYAVNKLNVLKKEKTYKEAKFEVSQELNHSRGEITEYYLQQKWLFI